MKRIRDCYWAMTSPSEAYAAFREATRNKMNDREVRALFVDPKRWTPFDQAKVERLLQSILAELRDGSYLPRSPRVKRLYCTSISKGRQRGKWRTLYCPCLRDLIVQHMLVNASMSAFTRGMYRWCEGSVPGRGPTEAMEQVRKWCRNDGNWAYFVELDIYHFFDEIQRTDIEAELERRIKDRRLLAIHRKNLGSAPIAAPVGYYSSPWYANLLLEALDHYILEQLYKTRRGKQIPLVRHYIRYIDNLLLFGSSKRDLEKVVYAIQKWLNERYGLCIKPSWEIKHIAVYDDGKIRKGTYRIKFLGYAIDRNRTILAENGYLSTKHMAGKLRRKREYRLGDFMGYVSKAGYASHTDKQSLERELNRYYPLSNAKEMIRHAARMDIF